MKEHSDQATEPLFKMDTLPEEIINEDYNVSSKRNPQEQPNADPMFDPASEPLIESYDMMSIAKLFIDEHTTRFIRDNFDNLYEHFQSSLKENLREFVGSFMESELD